jgi:hypothetical protein
MMRRLPWRIFADWMEYARREPFGELRADLRAGQIAAVMSWAYGGDKAKHITAATFFPNLQPFVDRQRQEKTPDMLYHQLAALTISMGGTIIRRDDDKLDA